MKETDFINIIKETLTDNRYIGNDCADLKDSGMFITQDILVQDVHFDLKYITANQLGKKAVAVNISDLATAICTPAYISVGLSLPKEISEDFVRDFYKGVDDACKQYGVVVTGGDITRGDKVYISVTALGKRRHSIDTSRSFAKPGNFIISTGNFGTSAAGLYALKNGLKVSEEIINAHLTPVARLQEAFEAGCYLEENVAVMDSSDGLGNVLYTVAEASNVRIKVNFEELPVSEEVKELAKSGNIDLKDWVLWGGEDYELLFFVPYYYYAILSSKGFKYVGYVESGADNNPCVDVYEQNDKIIIDKNYFNLKSYNHFGG